MMQVAMAMYDRKLPTITAELCRWASSLQLNDIPDDVLERTRYLILDGLACAIVGSHLPWSEIATNATLSMESEGPSSIWGWDKKVGPLAAALLNSCFIQAFELDDFHAESPIHSSSVVLPAICALMQQRGCTVDDSQFLLAAVVGYEVGPRIGLALWGADILSRGWHSGAVFGPAASAAACSKFLNLSAEKTEDALGIACTQACGLMSAQYGSMLKRMQHGFASRNGLFSAIMASQGYTGIKAVLETPFGGFISTFGNGGTREPPTVPRKVTEDLGVRWEIQKINVKPYASMAGTHGTIDCVSKIQETHPDALKDIEQVETIIVEMSEAAFKKGGWTPSRPVESTAAQMSAAYAAACQIVDDSVLVAQFTPSALNRDEIWDWIAKIQCVHNPDFDTDRITGWYQRMEVTFADHSRRNLSVLIEAPKGVSPLLTNEEILEKWKSLTQDIIDDEARRNIEDIVLSLGAGANWNQLLEILGQQSNKPVGF